MKLASKFALTVWAVASAAIIAGCGGGADPEPAPAPAPAAAQRAQPVEPGLVAQMQAKASPLRMAVNGVPSDADFFAFVQRQWPQFFHGASTEGQIATFHYRFFPDGAIYVAVSNGTAYVLGEITGWQLVAVAPVTVFSCQIYPGTCPTDKGSVYATLNQARDGGGFGALTIDGRVEAAAQAHADFLGSHYLIGEAVLSTLSPTGGAFAHWETAGFAGFTGATSSDRIKAAGFPPVYATEVVTSQYAIQPATEPDMVQCVSVFIASVFHRASLFDTAVTAVGIGHGPAARDANGNFGRFCVIDLAAEGATRTMPVGWSGVYPYPGQTVVATAMLAPEVPDPVPAYAVKGMPISLQVPSWYNLSVTSFAVTDAAGRPVDGTLLTRSQTIYLRTNEAYFVPNGALQKNTTYNVSFTGVATGTQVGQANFAVNRSWSFTTGSN